MAEDLVALSDLKAKFSEFGRIGQIVSDLNQNLAEINTANRHAAGEHDATAHAYHRQVDDPTNGLVTLVDAIAKMFDITGNNGKEVADTFNNAENNAQHTAQSW